MENQRGLSEREFDLKEFQSDLFTLHAVVLGKRRTTYTADTNEIIKLSSDDIHGLVLYDLYSGVSGVFRILTYGSDVYEAYGARSYREVVQEIEHMGKQDGHGEVARVEPLVYIPRAKLWKRIESYEFTRALSEFQPTRETRRRSLWYAAKSHIMSLLGGNGGV